MEPRARPVEVLKRICEEKGVNPGEMLAHLLIVLESKHSLHVTAGMMTFNHRGKPTVLGDIQGTMQLVGRPDDIPSSVLDALDPVMEAQQWLDTLRAKDARERNLLPQAAIYDHHVKLAQTLRLVIRELVRVADHRAIGGAIAMDKMAKDEGWLPVNPPPGDDAPMDEDEPDDDDERPGGDQQ